MRMLTYCMAAVVGALIAWGGPGAAQDAGQQPPAVQPGIPALPPGSAPAGHQEMGRHHGGTGMMGHERHHGGMAGGPHMMPRHGRMGGMGMPGGDMTRYVEGRIAFLEAELKITEAQREAWNGLAEALRANAKNAAELRALPRPATIKERLARRERVLAGRLENVQRIRSAYERLEATFSDEQRAIAEELVGPYVGRM